MIKENKCCQEHRKYHSVRHVEVLGKINWHDKMTSAYSKSCGYKNWKSSPSTLIQKSVVFKLFHSGKRFQKVPFSWIFLYGYKRISVDWRRIRNNKVPFSNLSGIVWTGSKAVLKILEDKRKYNMMMTVYKCINQMATAYLCRLFQPRPGMSRYILRW